MAELVNRVSFHPLEGIQEGVDYQNQEVAHTHLMPQRLLPQPQRWTVEILLLLRHEEMGKEDVWVSYRVVEDGASYLPLLVHQVHPSVQLQTNIHDILESM